MYRAHLVLRYSPEPSFSPETGAIIGHASNRARMLRMACGFCSLGDRLERHSSRGHAKRGPCDYLACNAVRTYPSRSPVVILLSTLGALIALHESSTGIVACPCFARIVPFLAILSEQWTWRFLVCRDLRHLVRPWEDYGAGLQTFMHRYWVTLKTRSL